VYFMWVFGQALTGTVTRPTSFRAGGSTEGNTWTYVTEVQKGSSPNNYYLALFRRVGAGESSQTWGVNYNETQTRRGIIVLEGTDVDTTTPIVQTNVSTDGSNPPNTTLSEFADGTNNLCLAASYYNWLTETWSAEAGGDWALLYSTNTSVALATAWRTGEDQTPTIPYSKEPVQTWLFIGAEIAQAAAGNVSAEPTTAALSYTGFAPAAGASNTATPSVARLSLAAYAPTITVAGGTSATPSVGNLTFATSVPTVDLGIVTSVITTTSTVAVGAMADISMTPGVARLEFIGNQITVETSVLIEPTPGVAALEYTGYAPTITAVATITVTPGVARLFYRGWRPIVTGTRIRSAGWGKPFGTRGTKKLVRGHAVDEHDVGPGKETK
jgi:hypothetical protein